MIVIVCLFARKRREFQKWVKLTEVYILCRSSSSIWTHRGRRVSSCAVCCGRGIIAAGSSVIVSMLSGHMCD
jgi:hypothetical protein